MRSTSHRCVAARPSRRSALQRAVRLLLPVCCLLLLWAAESPAGDTSGRAAAVASIEASDLERIISVLADDTFEGREAGSRGGRAAAGYLMRRFAALKLKPAGVNGSYWQPFGSGYRNILARLDGADPKLRHEYIVVCAHFDHVGYGNPRNSYGPFGYIHNGADDNASGSATLLEIAEAFTKLPVPPRRSVLFALWDAEEKGLLGSRYWLDHPTIDRKQIAFALNLDMVGRLRNDRVEVYGSRTAAGLRRRVIAVNDRKPLWLDFIFTMKSDSDHYPFFEAQIPVVMLHTGLHEQYHRPTDDVERINFAGTERVARLAFRIALDAADGPAYQFRSASRVEDEQTRARLESPADKPPLRLGVWWRIDNDPDHPLVIRHVVPGSAAANAGLQVGDRIVAFGKADVASETSFQQLVRTSPVETTITVRRAGKPQALTLPVELAGDAGPWGMRFRADPGEPGTAIVSFVAPGSPAAAAHVKVGDRVYRVDGEPFESLRGLRRRLRSHAAPWKLQVERHGVLRERIVGGSNNS